jgi:photosystem II stability/assembly factor-like uncharacterized protein
MIARTCSGRMAAVLLTTLLLVVQAAPVDAQRPPAAPQAVPAGAFEALQWRSVGPNRAGRSIAVGGSDARPHEYWFGATGGGVWKTTDGGVTWFPVGDGQFASSSAGAIGVCAADPDVVYAGFGEVQFRGNIIPGDGVYVTRDGGTTWSHVGLASSTGQQMVSRVRVHPRDCNRVYAAVLGDPFGPNNERGVFRSSDGGRSWERVLFRSERAGAVDLVLDPSDPDVMFAGFWQVQRRPWQMWSGGEEGGLFRSTDGGTTWTELTRNPGLPGGLWGKVGVSVSGADPNRVYAIVEADSGGVFLSDDRGGTWERVSVDRNLRQRAFYYTRIQADPQDRETVYVLNVGFWRSTDAGRTWSTIAVPHGDNHDLWISPSDNRRMVEANDGGANVTVNGGETWTGQLQPTAQMYTLRTTAHFPYHICGGQQDNSTVCVPSDGDGSYWYAAGGCESGWVTPHARNPDIFFAACYGGQLSMFDRSTGQQRSIQIWPVNPMGHSAGELRERFQWTFPHVLSPHDTETLYAGSQHLWRSRDRGHSWERISGDLTHADPETLGPSGGPITRDQTSVEYYATIFSIAPSPHDAGTIWTGSDDGRIHVTRDGGGTWQDVTPAELPKFSRVHYIDVSPHRPGTAYAAVTRYRMQDIAPYIFRTTDYGRSWTKIVTGIRHGDHVRGIVADHVRDGLLFAGTENGVYVSFDDGARWHPLQLDLPVSPIHALAVRDNDVIVATHGRSYYVLDDITPLRQLAPPVAAARAHLYRPAPAVRSQAGTVNGDNRYIGGRSRPLSLAGIYYHLREPAQEVRIEVLDARGTVISTSTARPPAQRAAAAGGAAQTAPASQAAPAVQVPTRSTERHGSVPSTTRTMALGTGFAGGGTRAGLNVFRWNLRHPGPGSFPGMILWGAGTQGPLAPPGDYQVRLSVDGSVVGTQPLRIVADPRLGHVMQAEFEEQFRLAMQIRDRTSQANDAVVRIRRLRSEVETRLDGTQDAGVRQAATALLERIRPIEEEIYQVRLEARQDPLNYPIRLNNKIAALLGQVESWDGRPTQQQYEIFRALSDQLESELQRLDAAVSTELAELNRRLQAAGLEPIQPPPAALE